MDKQQILNALSLIDSNTYYENLDVSEIIESLDDLITKLQNDIDEDSQAITLAWLKEIGFERDINFSHIFKFVTGGIGIELFSTPNEKIHIQLGLDCDVQLPNVKTRGQLKELLFLLEGESRE